MTTTQDSVEEFDLGPNSIHLSYLHLLHKTVAAH